jgi:hypothetical protein
MKISNNSEGDIVKLDSICHHSQGARLLDQDLSKMPQKGNDTSSNNSLNSVSAFEMLSIRH